MESSSVRRQSHLVPPSVKKGTTILILLISCQIPRYFFVNLVLLRRYIYKFDPFCSTLHGFFQNYTNTGSIKFVFDDIRLCG